MVASGPTPQGMPAATSMAAWPFAMAAKRLMRRRVRNQAVRCSDVRPSASTSAAALFLNLLVSHSTSLVVPVHISPCVVMTAGKKDGLVARAPIAAWCCAIANRSACPVSLWLCMSCSVAEGCSDMAGSSVPSRSAVRVTSAATWDDVVGCTHD